MKFDHEKCYRCPARYNPELKAVEPEIFSLPSDICDWAGHEDAINEHEFCPVCQHDHSPENIQFMEEQA